MRPTGVGLAVGGWLLVIGCGEPGPPVGSCNDDLGGVWSDGARSWHAIDMRGSVELYPMFDSAETGEHSASALIFVRGQQGISGHYLQWESGPERTQRVRHSATIECAGEELAIAWDDARLLLTRGRP